MQRPRIFTRRRNGLGKQTQKEIRIADARHSPRPPKFDVGDLDHGL